MAGVSFAGSLPDTIPDVWKRATDNPFVRAVADGTIPAEAFHEWIRQDFLFVVGLTAFVRDLATTAPREDRAGLAGALASLELELERFREHAQREAIELGADTVAACSDYLGFLDDCRLRGYPAALTAYYGCERAYLESWSGVRTEASLAGRYGDWIDNWSSAEFRSFVEWLGERLDAATASISGSGRDELRSVFGQTVSHEIAFWDACWSPRS